MSIEDELNFNASDSRFCALQMPIDMALRRNHPIDEKVVVDADTIVDGKNLPVYYVNLNKLGCAEEDGSRETLVIDYSPLEGGRMCVVVERFNPSDVSKTNVTLKDVEEKRATEISALIRNFEI